MSEICIYFQVHQPNRLKPYTFFEMGRDHFYENDFLNGEVLARVAEKCYLPTNELLLRLINETNGAFKVAFSLSGVFLEQLENHRSDVLDSFKRLAATGKVEFLAETYYHSLAFNYSKEEFKKQVKAHEDRTFHHFGVKPKVFRNTELIYNNEVASCAEEMGYVGVLGEGVDWYLNGRTPNLLYKSPTTSKIKTLLKNHKLSDDIAFRFGNPNWSEHPLTPSKYVSWLKAQQGDVINLFIDYETIGEHKWADTGIFEFWKNFPKEALKEGFTFSTPTEIVENNKVKEVYDVHKFTSWADSERDLSAWCGNDMQKEALDKVFGLEPCIKQTKNLDLWHVWRKLQTSDHFYYMSTKHENDGAVHAYFSPYNSPYDAYIFYMNILSDLEITLEKEGIEVRN